MQDAASLESFFHTAQQDVEKKINELVSDEKILMILNRGKRLRPLLGCLAYKTCTAGTESAEDYQRFLETAVSVELAHNASLVHDDIIDGDELRRGEPAFHISQGLDNAILIGHKMLVIGFHLTLSHGEKAAQLYMNTWNNTLDGQLTEVNFNHKDLDGAKNISADSKFFQLYSKIIDLKTASLFASACNAAGIEAYVSDELCDALYAYGREVGFSYQLADDLADLEKGERIDSVVIPLLNRLEKKQKINGSLSAKILKDKLERHIPEIKELYLSEIKKHIEKAQEICARDIFPKNPYHTLLAQAPTFIINAMLKEIKISI